MNDRLLRLSALFYRNEETRLRRIDVRIKQLSQAKFEALAAFGDGQFQPGSACSGAPPALVGHHLASIERALRQAQEHHREQSIRLLEAGRRKALIERHAVQAIADALARRQEAELMDVIEASVQVPTVAFPFSAVPSTCRNP